MMQGFGCFPEFDSFIPMLCSLPFLVVVLEGPDLVLDVRFLTARESEAGNRLALHLPFLTGSR